MARPSRKTLSQRTTLDYDLDSLLESVLTQPTAPFRESWAKRACMSFCQQIGIPVFEDRTGNMWVNARNAADARNASLVFVAHLDHPGVVITKFRQSRGKIFAEGEWLGGGPMDIRNFDIKVFSEVNALSVFDGVVVKHTSGPRGPAHVVIEIKPSPLAIAACTPQGLEALGPWGACLWYGKQGVPAGVTRRRRMWVTKAADDLVGACALMEGLRRSGKPRGVVALLTRAEESGFHGTLRVLRDKILDPSKTLMVSVETSSQLPGAELGKGPVVRLGDRSTMFDPKFVYWVGERAAELARENSSFKYQRRVMDGGSCEATAFNTFGFQVAGISTPLANYHNMSPSGRPLPEAVGVDDVENLTVLISHLMSSHRKSHARGLMDVTFKRYAARLLEGLRSHEKYFDGF